MKFKELKMCVVDTSIMLTKKRSISNKYNWSGFGEFCRKNTTYVYFHYSVQVVVT